MLSNFSWQLGLFVAIGVGVFLTLLLILRIIIRAVWPARK
jgi:hypothetical protein